MSSKFPLATRFYFSQIKNYRFTFFVILPLVALPITIYCYVALFEYAASSPVQYFTRNHKEKNNYSNSHTREQTHDNEDETKIDINADHMSKAESESLPTVSDIEKLYGPKVVIDGLDSCKAYRDNADEKDRWMAPAGLYNTVSAHRNIHTK